MKKKYVIPTALIVTLALLSGCGSGAAADAGNPADTVENADSQTADALSESNDAVKTEEVSPEAGTEAKEESKDAEKSAETEAAQEDKDASSDQATISVFGEEFKNGPVVNNGNYFVRVGDHVYFRESVPEALEPGVEFGEFLYSENAGEQCNFVSYDLNDHTWVDMFSVQGCGKLYACPKGFYLGYKTDNNIETAITTLIDPDTADQTEYCKGAPIGISGSGNMLAVERLEGQFVKTVLVKDGKDVIVLGGEGGSYDFCGFAGDSMIALYWAGDDGVDESDAAKCSLVSIDENGSETVLGTVTSGDSTAWGRYPEPGQLMKSGSNYYLGVGYYEGSGHFLTEWQALKFVPDKADSMTVEFDSAVDALDEDMTEEPRMFIDQGDVLDNAKHIPGDIYLTYGQTSNDLVYCNDIFEDEVIIKDYILPADSRDDHLDSIVQDMALFDETAFVIIADVEQDPEYDLGWRTGYRLVNWYTTAIPFDYDNRDADGQPKEIQYIQKAQATGSKG